MISHPRDQRTKPLKLRSLLVQTWALRWKTDGLSSLKYTVDSYENETVFANVTVNLCFQCVNIKENLPVEKFQRMDYL